MLFITAKPLFEVWIALSTTTLRSILIRISMLDLTTLAPDYIGPLGGKIFDTQPSLLKQNDDLERTLISQNVIDCFTAFTVPGEFCQMLKARRGADYWGNKR